MSEDKPDRRRIKGAVRRETILQVATELFSTRGYAATGVQEICVRSGVEKAGLYWHFNSKEALLAEVVDRIDAAWVADIRQTVATGTTPVERLDLFVDGLECLVREKGHLVRLMLGVAIERSSISNESRAAIQSIRTRTRDAIIEGFALALGVRLPDLDLVARLVIAFLEEATLLAAVDPEGAEHRRFFAYLRRLIILDIEDRTRAVGAETS